MFSFGINSLNHPPKQIASKQGFILTRSSFDYYGKAHICLWVSTDEGIVKLNVEDEKCILFVEQTNLTQVKAKLQRFQRRLEYRNLALSTFNHQPVCGLYFSDLSSFYEARKILASSGIEVFEGTIRLEERFLMERFVYGSVAFVGQQNESVHCQKSGYKEYQKVKVKPSQYVPKLSLLSLDLECSEYGELYSVGFYMRTPTGDFSRVIMIDAQREPSKAIPATDSSGSSDTVATSNLQENQNNPSDFIQWASSEKQLLVALEKTINQLDPDLIIGWNVINFDFRLLHRRATKHGVKLNIGRDGSPMRWRENSNEANQGFISIEGRVVLDGIAALKAESYSFPSFSLQAMAEHFLGKGKLTDDVDNRMESINFDFKHNKQKLAEYNLQDCILVTEIFEKARLLDYLILRSQLTGLELDRAGGSVAAFVNLYLPQLHRHGYVSPNLPEGGGLASPGGYVMNSKPGLYNNVLVLDFKSLYPSIIRTFKIDPLGLVEGLKNPEQSIEGFKGAYFAREKHLLPNIITELWAQRDQAKQQQDQARSQALKIIMNSFYGVLGSGGCPFYDTRLASSITMRGHEIMQRTAEWIEQKGLQVIYGDTDSTFVLLGEGYDPQQANDLGKSLAEFINTQWQLTLAEEHGIDCFLELEFETHFSKFLMPTIRGAEQGSKKRYAGLIAGTGEPKLIFKGLENVRTDWTLLAKEFQQQLYQIIFDDQDPTELIKQTVSETFSGARDHQLVYRKRLRRKLDSYVKNVPPHVKAARLADLENKKRNKPLKYQNKGSIAYLMTLQGPQAVEYQSAPIDYQFYIDRQIEPVADAILPFVGLSFQQIIDAQMGLF